MHALENVIVYCATFPKVHMGTFAPSFLYNVCTYISKGRWRIALSWLVVTDVEEPVLLGESDATPGRMGIGSDLRARIHWYVVLHNAH